jgi:hypothetical protein
MKEKVGAEMEMGTFLISLRPHALFDILCPK